MHNHVTSKYVVKGIVQGVGFRPFIYKIAQDHRLTGWVLNDSNGVTIVVQGYKGNIDFFIKDIRTKPPSLATVNEIELLSENTSSKVYKTFEIRESKINTNRKALISPDTNVCEDCLNELFNPSNRRYKYPFINCTNCGPRYSIIENIPYDRKYTTMKSFQMCKECEVEYKNVLDRRFHAQPVACWKCGPQVSLINNKGKDLKSKNPIENAVNLLKIGSILAIKGLGGFHLVVDPENNDAVRRLRKLKQRNYKPFALMSETISDINSFCDLNSLEKEKLLSRERPIVLLKKKFPNTISDNIAPNMNSYGVMLPYAPLHYLLLRNNFKSLICTSANITDEPMVFKNDNAIDSLSHIVDYFLIHNREIYIRCDDSIVSCNEINKSKINIAITRRARGYVPTPFKFKKPFPSGLALGAELKNTICLNRESDFFVSQHIGDLKNLSIFESYKETIKHLSTILEIKPNFIACDFHPGFYNTRYAYEQNKLPVIPVQHHHAHMTSCMFENGIQEPVIGVIFDGVGYGLDGNSWGGEFFIGDYNNFKRVAHFDYFPLLGGDKAVENPYRIVLNFLFEIYKEKFNELPLQVINRRSDEELAVLYKMKIKKINSPLTSSVGRIFDAASALIGVREIIEYEGQAAIELEQIAYGSKCSSIFPYEISTKNEILKINIMPLFGQLTESIIKGSLSINDLSRAFHNTITQITTDVCVQIKEKHGLNNIVLSGGVFQNQYLLKSCYNNLTSEGFNVFIHSLIPTNDGGISLGQAIVASHKFINIK